VVPVISLDACHLKSQHKGTLYLATAQSPLKEIYTIAIGVSSQNECLAEWNYFLRNLKIASPILETPDPTLLNNKYNKFTFISDREKGIISGLENYFPNNHHIYCAFHIKRNVFTRYSKAGANQIINLAKTFSTLEENKYFDNIEKLSKSAYNYVENIDPTRWRSTAWLDDTIKLPPRFGIVTSNVSESSNHMLEEARVGTWLYTIEKIWDITSNRISEKYLTSKNMEGVVVYVKTVINKYWETCNNYSISQINEEEKIYKVTRSRTSTYDTDTKHILDVINKNCTCGKWQDRQYPCVDACAYYKLYEKNR
jgi:hypothetical protein